LLIAPIGDPTAWRLAEYAVNGKSIKSCCSATAIITANTEKYHRAKLVIYAMDSLTCSNIQREWRTPQNKIPRKELKETLEKLFLEELENTAKRTNTKEIEKLSHNKIKINKCEITIEAHIAQAAGEFTINQENPPKPTAEFNGDPTAVFWKITQTQLNQEHKNQRIILDLTHGINYMQSMSIYAVEILKTIKNLQNIEIHNSSPYPASIYETKTCFTTTQKTKPQKLNIEPTLKILDITGISNIWDLAKTLSTYTITQEQITSIKTALQKIKQDIPQSLLWNLRRIILAIFYLSHGITTIGYYNLTKINRNETKQSYLEYKQRMEEAEDTCEVVESEHKLIIRYTKPTTWAHTIPVITTTILTELEKITDIPTTSDEKITVDMDKLVNIVEKLSQRNPLYNTHLTALNYEKKEILNKAKTLKKIEFSMTSREDTKIIHSPYGIRLSQLNPTERKRHLIAHAGITYEPITHIKINPETNTIKLTIDPQQLTEDPLKAWPQ